MRDVMHIVLVDKHRLPVFGYGGSERITWWLAKGLAHMGHRVTLLTHPQSKCPFAKVIPLDKKIPLEAQIPRDADVVQFQFKIQNPPISIPYVVSIHGNGKPGETYDPNSVFLSQKHAENHGASCFVYCGLDPEEYGPFDPQSARKHFLFLAKASRKVKNLKGCIRIAKALNTSLAIVGGRGWSFDPRIRYMGYLDGEKKNQVLRESIALLFPVLWEEPFGLAMIEALYHGAPVYGTPFGSLPELVPSDVGFLSSNLDDLIASLREGIPFDRKRCHEWVCDHFLHSHMAKGYLQLYEKVGRGEKLNPQLPVKKAEATRYVQ